MTDAKPDDLVVALRNLVTAWDNHRTLTKHMERARCVLAEADATKIADRAQAS